MQNALISWILNQNVILFYFINTGMENSFLNFLMPLITDFGSSIAWGIVCILLFIFGGKKGKKVAIIALTALFLANVAVYFLKILVAEPRPFLVLPNVHVLIFENEIYTFPSGHTASSFAAAVVIGLKYKLNFKGKTFRLIYPLLAFAAVIGFSRIYIGVHYPYDVLFGAIIGILSTVIAMKIEDNVYVEKISQINIKDKLHLNKIKKQ